MKRSAGHRRPGRVRRSGSGFLPSSAADSVLRADPAVITPSPSASTRPPALKIPEFFPAFMRTYCQRRLIFRGVTLIPPKPSWRAVAGFSRKSFIQRPARSPRSRRGFVRKTNSPAWHRAVAEPYSILTVKVPASLVTFSNRKRSFLIAEAEHRHIGISHSQSMRGRNPAPGTAPRSPDPRSPCRRPAARRLAGPHAFHQAASGFSWASMISSITVRA